MRDIHTMALRRGSRGFMAISFVIAMSLVMMTTLRDLASIGGERAALEAALLGRRQADESALDCAYVAIRALASSGDIRALESRRVPLVAGHCAIEGLRQGSSWDGSFSGAASSSGVHASFGAHAWRGAFESIIDVEASVSDQAIDLIRI